MSKRKPMDKTQARQRRNQLLETAAAAELSLTEGVREMRAIAGMTQEEFAQHRGVSARVIKAIELGQGNPTVATLNRIGHFFGLEVAFVPVRRTTQEKERLKPTSGAVPVSDAKPPEPKSEARWPTVEELFAAHEAIKADIRRFNEAFEKFNVNGAWEIAAGPTDKQVPPKQQAPEAAGGGKAPAHKKKLPRSS